MNREEFKKISNFDKNFNGSRYAENDILKVWTPSPHIPEMLRNISSNQSRKISGHQIIDVDQWGCERKYEYNLYETIIKAECLACFWNDGVSKEKLFVCVPDGVLTIKTPPCDDRNNFYLFDSPQGDIIYCPDNLNTNTDAQYYN